MNKLLFKVIIAFSLLFGNVAVFAETRTQDFNGIFEYTNENSVLNGIEIREGYFEISLNLGIDQTENDPFNKLYTQLINLDYQTKDAFLTGMLDPTKPKPSEIKKDLPTMEIHFSDIEKWKAPMISVIFTEPRYEIQDDILYISYKDEYLFKLKLDDQGSLLHNDEELFEKID